MSCRRAPCKISRLRTRIRCTRHQQGEVDRKRLQFTQLNEYNVAVNVNIRNILRTKTSSNVQTENDCWTKLQQMGQQG
jgi:hypothetical protein